MENKQKILSIQALRGYAIIGVFLCHEHVFDAGGPMGVSIFFILSGFLLTYKQDYPNDSNCFYENLIFAINKIKKLYPLHIATMIVGILLELYYGIHNTIEFIEKILSNIFLIQAWIPKNTFYFSLNGVAWYLSTLLFLYLIFPYLIKIIQKYRSNYIAIISMIISLLIQIGLSKLFSTKSINLEWSNYIFPLYRVFDFFIGCNLGYLVHNRENKENNAIKSNILEFTVLAITLFSIHGYYNFSYCYKNTVIFILSSISLIYVFAINKGILTKILTNNVIIFIGNMSPYIFLIHRLVIHWLWLVIAPNYLGISINKALECFISFFITLLFSILWKKLKYIVQSS